MTIALTNTTRRVLVVLLPHEGYCDRVGRCACTVRRDGARLAAALTLPARETVANVEEALLSLTSVASAVRAGDLRVTREESPEVPAAAAPAPTPVLVSAEGEPNEPRRPERRPDQSRRGAR